MYGTLNTTSVNTGKKGSNVKLLSFLIKLYRIMERIEMQNE